MLNNIFAAMSGYLEGRAIADVRDLRNVQITQLQMQFDALTDEEKERVRKAIAERQKRQPETFAQGFGRGFKIGIFVVILFILYVLAGGLSP